MPRRVLAAVRRRFSPPPPVPQSVRRRRQVQVRNAYWSGSALVLEGFAYLSGVAETGEPVRVSARRPHRRPVAFAVRMVESSEVDALVDDEQFSHARSAFVASLDVRRLRSRSGDASWSIDVGVQHGRSLVDGPVDYLYRWGSAGHVLPRQVRRGRFVTMRWVPEHGLHLDLTRPDAVLLEATVEDDDVVARVGVRRGIKPAAVRVGDSHELEVRHAGRRACSVRLDGTAPRGRHSLVVADEGGVDHLVWSSALDPAVALSLAPVTLVPDRRGPVLVGHEPARAVITGLRAELQGDLPMFVVSGQARRVDLAAVRLVGPRVSLTPDAVELDGPEFTLAFALWRVGPWADRPSAVLLGGYELQLPDGGSVEIVPDLMRTLYQRVSVGRVRVRLESNPAGGVHLNMTRPRADREIGAYNRRVAREQYLAATPRPREAVVFESFSGRSANDNTLPVALELVRRRPDLPAFWSVTDQSVAVPDGIEPVLRYSKAWWDLIGSSHLIVTNAWLPGSFVTRPHQRVLQAWHGTPLKRMGLDRLGRDAEIDERKGQRSLVAQAGMWSALLAQNPFSEEVFRRAYRYEGEVAQTGYPRNDVLVSPDGENIAARTRDKLGIAADQRVVMYMPTWREDSKQIYAELDLEALSEALGDDTVVLVRGHSNTLTRGRRVGTDAVLDVTVYPEVSDLYLVADVLITDYSSAMFDFSVTGRPMIFFTPDIERYTTTLRGTYFDLGEVAPGPMVSTTREVIDAVEDVVALHRQHADRYRAWQQRFNPHDDGQATARAVDVALRGVE